MTDDAAWEAVRSALAEMQATLAGRLDRLEGGQVALSGRLDRLATQHETDLAGMRGDLTELRVALMARMDRLQDAMTAQREADIVNHGSVERVERIARAASEETRALAEQVGGMVRQIRRLETQMREIRGDP